MSFVLLQSSLFSFTSRNMFVFLLLLLVPGVVHCASTVPSVVTTTKAACPPNTYEPQCAPCGHCAGGSCDVFNGNCINGCVAGYLPPRCLTACSPKMFGINCSKECNYCETGCEPVNGICTGNCAAGHQLMPYCNTTCNSGTYGVNCLSSCGKCKGGAACNVVTGNCIVCDPGYKLPMCTSFCDQGHFGQNCSETCGNCEGSPRCNAISGDCARCTDNWKMPLCKECLPGQWGSACGQLCGHCGGDGSCDKTTGYCHEPCQSGWTSPYCNEKCTPGTYGSNCTLKCGNCKDEYPCRHDNGMCETECADGYEGILCQSKKKDLAGPIVGAVIGAGIIIAVSVVATLCCMRYWRNKGTSSNKGKCSNLASDALQDSVHDHSHGNYQNMTTPRDSVFRYDHPSLGKSDVHNYDNAETRANQDTESVYQNTEPGVTKMKTYKREISNSEATYGNV